MTYFPYLRPEWTTNCNEERLLGVSLTGIYDNKFMCTPSEELEEFLKELRVYCQEVNEKWADLLGIPASVARTCIKPSGTVSCLVDSSSGIHPRYAKYFLRRVRIDKKDPLYELMKDQGVMVEDELHNPTTTAVFTFALKAPDSATTTTKNLDPIDHLELWQLYRNHWCDHNPSVTVNYKDHEFMKIGSWVYDNFHDVCGVSFLPFDDNVYQQAPFEEITEEQYRSFKQVEVDWSQLSNYEHNDNTIATQTLACAGGSCEIVDLTKEN